MARLPAAGARSRRCARALRHGAGRLAVSRRRRHGGDPCPVRCPLHLVVRARHESLGRRLLRRSSVRGPAARRGATPTATTSLTVDDGMDCPNAEYTTIQAAVNAADPGDRIKVCRGTYPEQVTIPAAKSGIMLFSAGYLEAVIKAPPVMIDPGDIVHVQGARNVTIRHFTISGPLPDMLFCSLFTRTGVKVDGGGSLLLTNNHITEIRSASPLLRGCQNGIAVRAGSRARLDDRSGRGRPQPDRPLPEGWRRGRQQRLVRERPPQRDRRRWPATRDRAERDPGQPRRDRRRRPQRGVRGTSYTARRRRNRDPPLRVRTGRV